MLKFWIRKVRSGEPVWIDDFRAACEKEERSRKVTFRLTLFSGEQRRFGYAVPPFETPEERALLLDYLSALIYNMLSALGGQRLCISCGEADAELIRLLEETKRRFLAPGAGYPRIVRELSRICRTLGLEPFSFSSKEEAPQETASAAPADPASPAGRLRKAAELACRGARAGIDVGGTDIKFVLAVDGEIAAFAEYDWNPMTFSTAEETLTPIVSRLRQLQEGKADALDSIGVSYPDVVLRDRICGGETPKTLGMRNNPALDYETEFAKISRLKEVLQPLCRPGAPIRITNDGNMAAYTAALELACSGEDASLARGTFAHALGTSLGSGWLDASGKIPEIPLELYDLIIDLGSETKRCRDARDLRSVRNENSWLPGADRYVGQAAAFRYAWELAPELLSGYAAEKDGILAIRREGTDLRKACLEHLCRKTEEGEPAAEEIFREIGRAFGRVSREAQLLLAPETPARTVFGRFVKKPACFRCIREGFSEILPDIALIRADEDLAVSPLMKKLSETEGITVTQFGQAVGAVCFGAEG